MKKAVHDGLLNPKNQDEVLKVRRSIAQVNLAIVMVSQTITVMYFIDASEQCFPT